jgi:hypothetical protein
MLMLAGRLGIPTIAKAVDVAGRPSGHRTGRRLEDVGIGVHPTKHDNEPTVAANPSNRRKLVARSHLSGPPAPEGNRCLAYRSDGGARRGAVGVHPDPETTVLGFEYDMFPDAEVDGHGRARLLYGHDPVAGSATAEDGDVRYLTSPAGVLPALVGAEDGERCRPGARPGVRRPGTPSRSASR